MVLRVKDNIPFLPEKAIEATANALLQRYAGQRGKPLQLPIDLSFIVEDVLGFHIDMQPDDYHVLAYIDPNKRVICLNSNRSDFLNHVGGFEFTAAHEIGHLVLDHFEEVKANAQILPGLSNEPERFLYRDDQPDEKYKNHEFQANYFAGCLLMPKQLISSEVPEYDLLHWKGIYALAERFTVSPSAMTKRLQALKLIYVEDKKLYRSQEEAHGQPRLI